TDQFNDPPDKGGYGRPPEATKFKPGQSGNPRGRPKGSKNLATLTRKHLQTKVSVRENGRERRMSKLEIGITKMINRFADQGELQLFSHLKKLFDRPEAQTVETRLPIDVTRLTLEDWTNAMDEQLERLNYRTSQMRLGLGDAVGKTSQHEPPLPD